MGMKGSRKFRCEECGETRMMHFTERNRAAIPRCAACGSAHLEVVTDEGKKEIFAGNEVRLAGETPTLKLASGIRKNKLIT
jgi:Zn finger protein HypA/HybF involved in hydrogenase expression